MERMVCGITALKAAGDGEMTFSGYGAATGNVDAYGDVIAPGAFADTLSRAQETGIFPSMLSQHGGWGTGADDMTPVGVWTSLSEDGSGLLVEGKLADTQRGRDLYTLMKMTPRPAINGLSIGYIPKEWTPRSKPEEPKRTLKKLDLMEISLVTFPANLKARVHAVKAIEDFERLRDVECYLRESCGLSRSEAVTLVSRIKQLSLEQSDSGDMAKEVADAIQRRGI